MITIFFYMTVKPDQIDAFRAIVTGAFTTTHAEDAGCITYVFHQQIDNPYEFVLYEQWQHRARSMPIWHALIRLSVGRPFLTPVRRRRQ